MHILAADIHIARTIVIVVYAVGDKKLIVVRHLYFVCKKRRNITFKRSAITRSAVSFI